MLARTAVVIGMLLVASPAAQGEGVASAAQGEGVAGAATTQGKGEARADAQGEDKGEARADAKLSNRAQAQGDPPRLWEFSFGTSQLFSGQLVEDLSIDQELLPTTSALFIGERLIARRWSLVGLFNLPLTPTRRVVDGELRSEFAAPSLAFGATWTPLMWGFMDKSRFEIQLALVGGGVLKPGGDIFPLTAVRLRLLQDEGFALYLGAAFAFRVDTLALIYGVGHRF